MINIVFIADSLKHFELSVKEYEKRLERKINLIKLKPSKNGDLKLIIQKDTEKINKFLSKKKNTYNVLLSLNGNQLDTIKFSNFLESSLDRGVTINFIIGGAFGLNEEKLENIDYKLSLSKFTFPHILALVVLLEQIYRAFQIIKGRNYHY